MAKVLGAIGAGLGAGAFVTSSVTSVVLALASATLLGLGLVSWLTDTKVAIARSRAHVTWFGDEAPPQEAHWVDEVEVDDDVIDLGPPTANVVMKGVDRAGPRRRQQRLSPR